MSPIVNLRLVHAPDADPDFPNAMLTCPSSSLHFHIPLAHRTGAWCIRPDSQRPARTTRTQAFAHTTMLQSTSLIISPLRRRIVAGEARAVLARKHRLSPPHSSSSSASFSYLASPNFSADDDSELKVGACQYRPIRVSRSNRLLLSATPLASLAQDVSSLDAPERGGKIPQQVRHLSTSGPGGPNRSSTSAAQPSFSSSSNVPRDGDDEEKGTGSDRAGAGRSSRLSSARKKGQAAAKRGQAAAKRGQAAAKKGAIGVRDMIQKYGFTFLGTYFGLYFGTLGALFAGIDSGLLDPAAVMDSVSWIPGIHIGVGDGGDGEGTKKTVDIIVELMQKYDFTRQYADAVAKNPHMANLGIAWIATKFTEPIRLGVSLAVVPRIHRALGRDTPKI